MLIDVGLFDLCAWDHLVTVNVSTVWKYSRPIKRASRASPATHPHFGAASEFKVLRHTRWHSIVAESLAEACWVGTFPLLRSAAHWFVCRAITRCYRAGDGLKCTLAATKTSRCRWGGGGRGGSVLAALTCLFRIGVQDWNTHAVEMTCKCMFANVNICR